MAEEESRQTAPTSSTRDSLVRDLRQLGVQPGMTMIVHSSLRALGHVYGGPAVVVQALMDVLREEGTLVMPAHSANYSDPVTWQVSSVPQSWWKMIYEAMPAFDPLLTPTYRMGAIAETFRTSANVFRSNHPQVSFSAWGRHAEYITADHTLAYGLGEGSPLARIYELNGWVLLLGVGYDSNTSFHLAEYRLPNVQQTLLGAPILENGQRIWKRFQDIEIDADVFPEIGGEMERSGIVKVGQVGLAQCRLFPQRLAIDFALQWYRQRDRL